MPNVTSPAVTDNLRKYFSALCETNALLFKLGEQNLQDAVDELQRFAERKLVALIGQDEVQLLMHEAFIKVRPELRANDPNAADAVVSDSAADAAIRAAWRSPPAIQDGMTDDEFFDALNDPQRRWRARGSEATQATYNAVQYVLRTDGMKALKGTRFRLAEFSERQIKDLIISLQKRGVEEGLLRALAGLLDG